jgi:hypothetical protein
VPPKATSTKNSRACFPLHPVFYLENRVQRETSPAVFGKKVGSCSELADSVGMTASHADTCAWHSAQKEHEPKSQPTQGEFLRFLRNCSRKSSVLVRHYEIYR